VGKWFFAPESEDHLVEHLANTVVQYQEFRSGFAKRLNSLTGKELSDYVQSLRIDFIRQTHHSRSHRYVKSLGRHMSEEIMQPWGAAISHDLADICQSHGESMTYVEKMKTNAQYLGAETANLQFVAALLRVADIVHFSFDRAPSVLASEMQFRTEESLVHWAVKQQGVNYNIAESGEVGKKTARFRAYCTKPQHYYALHKYLDWVDNELANYARVSRRWELEFGKQQSEKWSIPLADEVDRSGIEYDSERFVPVPGLSFTLEQRRILELLMGVRLYKDSYACLRELYQNSLDACKCMIALSDGKEKGCVEFWLESRNSGKDVYLCCMDNGVGMTKDIIVNHLLRIGNSYYTSAAFERLRISHHHSFTPTSQFGIGILSCFMLGDSLDIVTRPMQEFSDDTSPIRCTVDGVHENFYYAPPDPVDMEMIGKHGTIVRLRLTDPGVIIGSNDGKIWLRHFAIRIAHGFQNVDKALFADWDKHIHNIVTRFVSLPPKDVNVSVRLTDEKREPIFRWDRPFHWQEFNIEESDVLRVEEFRRKHRIGESHERDTSEHRVQIYFCTTEHEGIEFSWVLELPSSKKEVIKNSEYRMLHSFGAPGLSVNGVHIEGHSLGSNEILEWLCHFGHLNFTGNSRPVLSVDRTSITSWPQSVDSLLRDLTHKVAEKTLQMTKEHIEKEGMVGDDPMVLAAWDRLLSQFSPCRAELLTAFASDERYSDVLLSDIANLTQNTKMTLREFLDADKVCFQRIAYHSLSPAGQLLFYGKCGTATRLTAGNDGVCVEGIGLSPILTTHSRHWGNHHYTEILLRCDGWSGRFSEYDLVTDFWPAIPPKLFDCLLKAKHGDRPERLAASERAIEIHRTGNGITALGEQDPCLVHPRFGLYHEDPTSWSKELHACKVGRFDKASNDHWLFEINDYWEKESEPVRNVLFMFVSPRVLNPEEELRLKEFESSDPDYVKGVREGWSLLFLGRKHMHPIICAGLVSRRVVVGAVPDDIWGKLEEEEYRFIDGTPLLDLQ
jgi:hypothetical protein